MSRIVLSLLTKDRPGVVKDLSNLALSHGANWLESRMAQLAGQFAGLVLLEVPENRVDELLTALQNFGDGGTQVLLSKGEDIQPLEAAAHIELDGADHPGIVHQISQMLAASGVNILELSTAQHPAAMSAQPIFSARIAIDLPSNLTTRDLAAQLDNAADELMVDLRLQSS